MFNEQSYGLFGAAGCITGLFGMEQQLSLLKAAMTGRNSSACGQFQMSRVLPGAGGDLLPQMPLLHSWSNRPLP